MINGLSAPSFAMFRVIDHFCQDADDGCCLSDCRLAHPTASSCQKGLLRGNICVTLWQHFKGYNYRTWQRHSYTGIYSPSKNMILFAKPWRGREGEGGGGRIFCSYAAQHDHNIQWQLPMCRQQGLETALQQLEGHWNAEAAGRRVKQLTVSRASWNLPSLRRAPASFCHQGRSMPCRTASTVYGEGYFSSYALLLAALAIWWAACTTQQIFCCCTLCIS